MHRSVCARRVGRGLLLACFVFVCAPGLAGEPPGSRAPADEGSLLAGPLVGFDGPNAARIWVAPRRAGTPLAVEIAPATGETGHATTSSPRVVSFPPATVAASGGGLVGPRVLRIGGLRPRTRYDYRILVGDARRPVALGHFRTAPPVGKPVRARIALVSCMNVKRHPRQVAWPRLLDERPDLLLHLGDNVYADTTEPEKVRRLFFRQRRVPEYAAALRQVSTLAIWDDHDYGRNDGDGTLPTKARSLASFRSLWPNPAAGTTSTPGVFFRISYGDVDLFCLDTRYHRSPNEAPDDARKTMLGAGQWTWLEDGLRRSKATFKLVASGSTYVANFKDYWELYSHDLRRLTRLTETVPGIVLVSGDLHVSALRLVGQERGARYPLYEVVSSGIAVNREVGHYFTVLEVDTTAPDPTITVRWKRVDPAGRVAERWSHPIRRSALVPRR